MSCLLLYIILWLNIYNCIFKLNTDNYNILEKNDDCMKVHVIDRFIPTVLTISDVYLPTYPLHVRMRLLIKNTKH